LRRVLLTLVITLAVIFAGVQWVAPVVLSFYSGREAPTFTRVVPTELKDLSISQASGKKLSYFGYEFEIPWNDLDETQTKLYPKDKPKCRADLHFHSGLRLVVTAVRPRELVDGLAEMAKVSPQRIGATFGSSDYRVIRAIYEFTPDKMTHWSFSQRVYSREEFLLILKMAATLPSANSGIFNIGNQDFKGFQDGDPRVRQDGVVVQLFADDGSVEFIFSQKNYQNPSGLTQPEINRIIQSLRRTPQRETVAAR
jgi:hypothetical protein